MTDTLAWAGAIGGIAAAAAGAIAAIGSWRTEITARWQARVERLRNEEARRENELHRQRLTDVWDWWHGRQDGPHAVEAARWYYTWTGARPPLDPGADGPLPPGIGCRDADEAYERYLGSLEAQYEPGRLGPPRPTLPVPARRPSQGRSRWRLHRSRRAA